MSSREEVSAKYLTDYRSTTTEVDIYTLLPNGGIKHNKLRNT